MASQVIGAAQTALNVYQALYGMAPSNALYTNYLSIINTSGASSFAASMASSFANTSSSSLATTVLTNLGLGTGLATTLTQLFDGYGVAARGQIILNLTNLLSGLEGDATYGAAAVAWNAQTLNNFNYSVNTANTTSAVASTSTTGQSFTLTTNVDAVSGGAGDDVIVGLINSSATYTVGDNINGNGGNDTLNLIAQSATDAAGGLVSIDSVETVNVRLLTTAASALTMNATDWSGVAVLTNASSVAGTLLQVSGLSTTTKVSLYGDTDINVAYNSTTTATTAVTIALNDAGNFGTGAHTFAGTGFSATANIDIDLADAGLITSVNVEISGAANAARLEAGSNVTTYTLSGGGSSILVTDDKITSFNASALTAGVDITFEGASDVVANGGAGNDIFRFGTTFSNNDSVNGGAGTDTVQATVAGFNRNLNTTSVESATLTFTEAAGGDVNASGSTITAYTFAAGTAANAASVSQIANGATITLNDDDLGDVTLDYASGAATTTLNIGSVSGAVGLGTLTISDVAAVTINAVGVSGTVGGSITTASFDSDLKSLAITTSGGEADLTIGDTNVDMQLGGATSLTVTSNGSASITFSNVDLAGSQLTTVNVYANNTDAADIVLGDVSGSAITSVNLNAASAADITVGTLDLGNNTTATTQDIGITIVQGQTSNVTVGDITFSGEGTLTLNVTQNGTSIADIGTITIDRIAAVTADSPAGNLTIASTTVAGSGEYAINAINLEAAGTGAQLSFGTINITKDGGFSAGIASASAAVNVDVSNITVVVGGSASANFAGFAAFNNGAIGAINVNVSDAGSANFGAMSASSIGAATIVVASGAAVDVGALVATTGGSQTGGAVGAIEISGVDGADVTYGTINASAVGAISVSGQLDVTFGTITAARIGEVNNQNQGSSGNFTIDLSGVTTAVEVKLGLAANTITSGVGNDVITLTGGRTSAAGNDVIRYTATGQGTDNIINFIAGNAASGGDQIELATAIGTAHLYNVDGSAIANADSVDLSVAMTATGDTLVATDNVILIATAQANTAAMLTFLDGVTLTTAAIASAEFVVAWTDGTDTYVTVVDAIGDGSAGATTLASGGHTLSANTLAVLAGVTPGSLVAANFDFV